MVYHLKLINNIDCLVFGEKTIKTFDHPILYQKPNQGVDMTDTNTCDSHHGNIIEIIENDSNYLFTNINDILVYDNSISEDDSHKNDHEILDNNTDDNPNKEMEKTTNTILNILNDYILDIDHSSRDLKNQLDKKVILLNHNKHMLKDLTDQINFQRPVKRLRTDVSQFLFHTNYTNTTPSISTSPTTEQKEMHTTTQDFLNDINDYDEDDSHWLTLLSHTTTYSENYFYSNLRIKNTSKYILENIVLNPVFILSDLLKKEIKEKKKRVTMDFPVIHVSCPIHILLPEEDIELSLSFQTSLFYSELKLNLVAQYLCKDDYIYSIRSNNLGILTYSTLSHSIKDTFTPKDIAIINRTRKRKFSEDTDNSFELTESPIKRNSQVTISFVNPYNRNGEMNEYHHQLNKASSFPIDEPNSSIQKIVKFSEKNDRALFSYLLNYFQNNYSMTSEFFNHQALDYLLNYKLKSEKIIILEYV
ncbi:hypothetical protein BCR36DRAFT_366546 [Piromyces finnis]|uniref:Uncharacterized protein n=1 Tax=Piromyces finnis TaxID=1754191 RepID=A0A1Y1VLL5_9FUNG|nr:hypothetical protein BCR36DRAFT_366546 [Piromyces finnis]|eukprot:ORX59357.1 hypothetical protein BCR36DRAFT_366546 [Piromyces finnis]